MLFFIIIAFLISCKKENSNESIPVSNFSVSNNLNVLDTILFTNNSENCSEYYWDFDNGTSSKEKNPICVFTKPFQYKVQLLGIEGNSVSKFEKSIPITLGSSALAGTYTWSVSKYTWSVSLDTIISLPQQQFDILVIDDTTLSINEVILRFKNANYGCFNFRSDATIQLNRGELFSYNKYDGQLTYTTLSGGLGSGTRYDYYSVIH